MKNEINLCEFPKGQLATCRQIKNILKSQINETCNKRTEYILRDSRKDVLHTAKLVIQLDIWNFLLNQIIELEKEIQDEEQEEEQK